MKKYLSLVKLLFVQQYRIKPSGKKRKKGGTIALFVLLGLCFLPMLIGVFAAMYYLGQVSRGIADVGAVCAALIIICQGVVFVFGIPALISNVFTVKDADKLLFLPIRSASIFESKITVVYLNEVITTAVTVIVILLPFGIGLGAGAGFYLLLIPALVLIPLLPMLLGCIIAVPLSALITKFSNNGIFKTVMQTVLYIILMAVYIAGMYYLGFFGGSSDDITGGADSGAILLEKLQQMSKYIKYVHSNYTLAVAMTSAAFGALSLNLVISVAENVFLFALVLLMSVPFYHRMLTVSVEGGGRGRHKKVNADELQVKNQGVVKELIFTDIKRVTRDSQMGFQCIMSLIILPLMVGIFALAFGMSAEDEGSILEILQVQPMYQLIAPIVFVGYMSMLGMTSNVLGIYPISRENKSIYIIKSLPLSFSKYLFAKVLLATLSMVISNVITCLLIVILFKVQWFYGILMLVTMALLGFGTMCIMTLVDLKNPKLGWTNFNQSLKNAKNSWIAMLVGFLCMIALAAVVAPCAVGWALTDGGWYMTMVMWLLIIGLSAGYAVVSYKVMASRAQRYFEQIEP